jgi:hypothetical protein
MQNDNVAGSVLASEKKFREEERRIEEGGMGEARHVSLTHDPRLRLFALFINLLLIIELFVAMFFASQDPDRLTPVFFTLFFSMLAPTIIAAVVGRRIIGKRLASKGA